MKFTISLSQKVGGQYTLTYLTVMEFNSIFEAEEYGDRISAERGILDISKGAPQ